MSRDIRLILFVGHRPEALPVGPILPNPVIRPTCGNLLAHNTSLRAR